MSAQRLRTTASGQAHIHAIRGLHGFTIAIEPMELPTGPWPLVHSAGNQCPLYSCIDPANSGAWTLLNQSRWTHAADIRDLAAAPDVIPFVVHEAKCTQATQRDSEARQRAKEAHLAASCTLIGYFLDPMLFERSMFIISCGQGTWNHLQYGMAQPPVSVTGKTSAGMKNHAAAAPNVLRPADS